MMSEKCCENCGNKTCLNMIVALLYDYCLENNYILWMPKADTDKEAT